MWYCSTQRWKRRIGARRRAIVSCPKVRRASGRADIRSVHDSLHSIAHTFKDSYCEIKKLFTTIVWFGRFKRFAARSKTVSAKQVYCERRNGLLL